MVRDESGVAEGGGERVGWQKMVFRSSGEMFLVFDLDGTLVDSRADLRTAVNAMRAKHGLAPLDVASVTGMVGDGMRKLAERALQGAEVDVEVAYREVSEAYAAHLTDETRPYAGVEEGLAALSAVGFGLGIATNKPGRHVARLLEALGWNGRFCAVVGGGDAAALKPSGAPVEEAMRRAGVGREDTWMVGDHHTDLAAARAAGVRSVFLRSGLGNMGRECPTMVFDDFRSMTAWFLEEGRWAP